MAKEKEYKVVGPHTVQGHATGEKFEAAFHPALELALVEGGHIKVLSKAEPLLCPHCAEHGKTVKEKKRTYATRAELAEHYASDHPALQAPAGEEE